MIPYIHKPSTFTRDHKNGRTLQHISVRWQLGSGSAVAPRRLNGGSAAARRRLGCGSAVRLLKSCRTLRGDVGEATEATAATVER